MFEISNEENPSTFFERERRTVSLLAIRDRDCVARPREEIVDCGRLLLGHRQHSIGRRVCVELAHEHGTLSLAQRERSRAAVEKGSTRSTQEVQVNRVDDNPCLGEERRMIGR